MTLDQWLLKWDPTNFSFTVLVYVLVVSALIILWSKVLPYFINKRWPNEDALREKRATADIEARKDEIAETRLMRQALERQNAVSERMAILIEQHDVTARMGIDNIIGLLRIVLEKQGVEPSQVAAIIKSQNTEASATTELVKQIIAAATKQVQGSAA